MALTDCACVRSAVTGTPAPRGAPGGGRTATLSLTFLSPGEQPQEEPEEEGESWLLRGDAGACRAWAAAISDALAGTVETADGSDETVLPVPLSSTCIARA